MIEGFGGFDRFCREVQSVIQGNAATPAGRSRVICAVANMAIATDSLKLEAESAEREAWQKAQAEQLELASIGDQLYIVAPLFREHGWTVKPPR
ncbi:MAG: hypothetical protein AB7U20_19905 [Planctomycetaceae bacterium]